MQWVARSDLEDSSDEVECSRCGHIEEGPA